MLFAESPGFSPSREFSCFLPSPFVQLFCAQSGDPGGASASGQFSSNQEASKALGHTFLPPIHSAMTFSIVFFSPIEVTARSLSPPRVFARLQAEGSWS